MLFLWAANLTRSDNQNIHEKSGNHLRGKEDFHKTSAYKVKCNLMNGLVWRNA